MFSISLAGLVIGIDNRYSFIEELCSEYKVDGDPLFTVAVNDNEIKAERIASGDDFQDDYLETICAYRQIALALPQYDAFLLHSSVVCIDGKKAYAFAAKSGTGKTTHTVLWKRLLGDRMTVINGDKPIMRFINGKLFAFGTPWAGKENLQTNKSAELCGICFLEQAKQNTIRSLTPSETVERIMHQILLPKTKKDVLKTLSLIDTTVRTIPSYLLGCDISREAAELSFTTLTGEK